MNLLSLATSRWCFSRLSGPHVTGGRAFRVVSTQLPGCLRRETPTCFRARSDFNGAYVSISCCWALLGGSRPVRGFLTLVGLAAPEPQASSENEASKGTERSTPVLRKAVRPRCPAVGKLGGVLRPPALGALKKAPRPERRGRPRGAPGHVHPQARGGPQVLPILAHFLVIFNLFAGLTKDVRLRERKRDWLGGSAGSEVQAGRLEPGGGARRPAGAGRAGGGVLGDHSRAQAQVSGGGAGPAPMSRIPGGGRCKNLTEACKRKNYIKHANNSSAIPKWKLNLGVTMGVTDILGS
ncbi:uncharacterized protein [Notamacropus eugenii]|uniref:uncharacterized protein n=1 Tax=Notamacropus eugenii TaxID=9315 RepID=UPI003B67BA6B